MTTTLSVLTLIRTTLRASASLVLTLGGRHVNYGHISDMAQPQVPGVYLLYGNGTSTPRFGFGVSQLTDEDQTVQVDLFALTPEAVWEIHAVVNPLLLGGVAGTRAWRNITTSEQYEQDTKRWHIALRYRFEYITRN